jgi:hypothetical protein
VFFENSLCLRCATPLGFVPSALELVAMTRETVAAGALRRCANATVAGCNWMLEAGDSARLCRSCRLTRTRPGDSDAEGLAAFARAEAAKRRLLFGLFDQALQLAVGHQAQIRKRFHVAAFHFVEVTGFQQSEPEPSTSG